MKSLICFFLAILIAPACVFGQGKTNDPKTKMQAFEALTGAVVIKGFTTIGTIYGMGQVAIDARQFTDASNGRSQYGIAIEVKGSGDISREDTSFIDLDEIDSLVAGIDYVKKANSSITKLKSFEVIYRTKGDFTVTVFSGNDGKLAAAISSGSIGRATAYISLEKLGEIKTLIIQAKTILESIKK